MAHNFFIKIGWGAMVYRREIDGLRALAVIPVILFHAGFGFFGGGYAGVDVFFVISGYLITNIITSDIEAGRFSIINFYERRARRIVPTLILVSIVSAFAAWGLLLPEDFRVFSRSLVAVSLFGSNLFFWQERGYFDSDSDFKPLLHTWSLAVEEQYYLLFPIFLMGLWFLGRRRINVILACLALSSLALAHWAALHKPDAAFFLLPTRGWELLLGALLAMLMSGAKNQLLPSPINHLGSFLGLSMIVFAVLAFDHTTPFPGLYALVPTIGAALVILCATPTTWVGRLLGARILVGIGLISYSAYLWHQPLFAFARHFYARDPGPMILGILSIVVLILAYLSWRFVEQPFRHTVRLGRQRVFMMTALLPLMAFAMYELVSTDKIQSRWQAANPGLVNSDIPPVAASAYRACAGFNYSAADIDCRVRGDVGGIKVVVWGDSHAAILAGNIPSVRGVELYVISHLGCPPLIGVRRYDGVGNSSNCDRLDSMKVYAEYAKSLMPARVLLVGRWSMYVNGNQKQGNLQRAHHMLTNAPTAPVNSTKEMRQKILLRHFQETASFFDERTAVVVVSQVPDLSLPGYKAVARADTVLAEDQVRKWHLAEREVLLDLTRLGRVSVFDSLRLFCHTGGCRTRIDGRMLFSDDSHLTNYAATMMWAELVQHLVAPERLPVQGLAAW